MFPCYSLQLSHPLLPLPTMSISLFSVSVSPLLSCKHIHQYHISRFHVVAVVVQSLSHVWLFKTPWTEARQASLSLTISQSLPKFMSIESLMPSNHLILCHPLLLSSVFPSIRAFSTDLAVCIRWPKFWSFSFSISPSSEYSGLISFKRSAKSLLQHQFESINSLALYIWYFSLSDLLYSV